MSLINKSIKSIAWSAIERFSVQFIQLVVGIILARMVTPTAYGLIAMMTIFISIAQSFVDSGFASALIQKKDRTEADFNTVFYFNIVASVLLYIALYYSAPYIANFYREPSLELLCKWFGLCIIIQGFSLVQIVKLTILLDFKTQAKVSLIAAGISGLVGVSFAFYGYGVWALMVQALLGSALSTILLWCSVRWMPKLNFSLESLNSLFSFGSKLLVSGLLHSVYLNLYGLVIGRRYSAEDLGYYNQSSLYARFPSVSLMAVISRAIYPIQCDAQKDLQQLRDSFIKYLRMSCYIIFPAMLLLSVLADPLIVVFLTDKWMPASKMLMILSIAYMCNPLMVMNSQILNVLGRTDLFLKAELVKKFCGILILLATIPYGIYLICIGILFYNICDSLIIIYYSKKVLNVGFGFQVSSIMPIFAISFASAMITVFVIHSFSDGIIKIFLGLSAYCISYICLSNTFKIKEYFFLVSQSKKIIYGFRGQKQS